MESSKLNINDIFSHLSEIRFFKKEVFGIGNISRLAYYESILPPKAVYMTSGWGCIAPLAIGIALGVRNTDRILVVDGDGSFLHSPGFLVTMKSLKILNLHVLIIQNESYESTGGQIIEAFANGLNLSKVIAGYGFRNIVEISSVESMKFAFSRKRLNEKGPYFTIAKTSKFSGALPRIPLNILHDSFKRIKFID